MSRCALGASPRGLHGRNDLAPVAGRLPGGTDVVEGDDVASFVENPGRALAELPGTIHAVVDRNTASDALQNAVVAVGNPEVGWEFGLIIGGQSR